MPQKLLYNESPHRVRVTGTTVTTAKYLIPTRCREPLPHGIQRARPDFLALSEDLSFHAHVVANMNIANLKLEGATRLHLLRGSPRLLGNGNMQEAT